MCSHQYHIQTTELTAPSHIFTPCPSTGPNHRLRGRVTGMSPTPLTPRGRAGVAAGLWGSAHVPTSHTRPQVSTLATLDKESPCLGPFPKSTGKLTASQGQHAHLGKLVIQSVSEGSA